ASGTAPFVRGALEEAARSGAATVFLVCNPHHPPLRLKGLSTVVLETGPELVTGSTRLKAGTATKLALNLFSTVGMIRTGRVRDNLMVNVRPTNRKLRDRARRLVMTLAKVGEEEALKRLEKAKWDVAKAVDLKTAKR
ncbi:MAG TPA: N-acetylglucosamine kinase, partial [Candidatus Methylacidiphilales bacterium]